MADSAATQVTERAAEPVGDRLKALFTARRVILALVILILVGGLVWPFITTVQQSLDPPAYGEVFGTAGYRAVLWNTLQIAVMSTAVTVILAFALAHFMWNTNALMRQIMVVLLVVPFFTSILVKNFSWTVILQDSGPINQILMGLGLTDEPVHLLFTRGAVIVGMVHYMLPISVVPIYVGLMRVNKDLVRVARSMGASKLLVLFRITIPLAKTGLITSIVTTFVVALGFYITPAMLGGREDQMVANLIDVAIRQLNRFDLAAALSVIVFVGVIIMLPLALQMLRAPKEGK